MRLKMAIILPLAVAGVGLAAYGTLGGQDGNSNAMTALSMPLASPASAQPIAGGHPVAVELFTSQGCSSCPPADAVQLRLLKDPNVVAITRPVTYWDELGWKDTLAKPENTQLQRAYSARHIPGAGVYTPQSVVQGQSGTVGGRESKIRELIASASRQAEPSVTISGAAGGARTVALSGNGPKDARVIVAALDTAADVKIGRGENGGRSIRYTNVLVSESTVGNWTGGAARFSLPASALHVSGADRYALIVRQGASGPILAARYL